ncbi:MAG TPA: hypothetical protein VKB31_05010 [Trueperaceae bacterium]|nr:hypothetical protein [Trueperaceae bacterium]
MPERLAIVPTATLQRVSRTLELRIIGGSATGRDIDVYVTIESELGRRIAVHGALPGSLDAVLDPRD